MHDVAQLALLAVAVFAHGLVSGRLRTTPVTGPIVFVGIGLLSGPEVLDLVHIDLGSQQVIILVEATLAIVLFSDAVRVDPRRLRSYVGIPVRMLGVGLPLVMTAGTLLARVALGLDWADAALVGVILAATDAALGQAVLTEESVPARIRGALNVESGLNDGLALPAVTLFTAITVAEQQSESASFWIRFVLEQIGFGILAGSAVGALAGWVLVRAWNRGWADGISGQLGTLGMVGLAYVTAHALGGNSFLAAFIAGLCFRIVGRHESERLCEFSEDGGQLLAAVTFVLFGNALVGPVLGDLSPSVALFVAASLTVVRMVPIALSLLGTGLRPPTLVFLGWFGPRGLASILFALTVLEETDASPQEDLFVVVGWTVLVSVVVHGATASWAAGRYGRWYADHRATMHPDLEPSEGPMRSDTPQPRVRWTKP